MATGRSKPAPTTAREQTFLLLRRENSTATTKPTRSWGMVTAGARCWWGTARAPFTGGGTPRRGRRPASAVGDFNNDGKLDLAIAHLGSPGSVSVLLGKGDGTFQAGATYAVGVNLVAITVCDLNRDGKLDLALANGPSTSRGGLGGVTSFDARVSVLSGKGDGTFEPAAAYSAGLVPASLAAGDFNGDGKLDLIEVDGYASVVWLLLGNGDGTLQAAANYDVGGYPASVAEGDFNSDGKPDLAVANLANISVLMARDDGTLQTPVNYGAGSQPVSVAMGDFNGDGKLDLAVADYFPSGISVLSGKGDGTFQAAVKLDTESQPWAMAVGDFNGDGKSDLAVANVVSNNLSVFLGKSDGTLQVSASYDVGVSPRSVATGDFNGDGLTDVAVANSAYGGGPPSNSVPFGHGGGNFGPAVNYSAGMNPWSVAVGDFNSDGFPDLAVADFGSANVSV